MEVVVEYGVAAGVGVEGGEHPEADQDPADGISRLAPGHHHTRQGDRHEEGNLPSVRKVADRPGGSVGQF